MISEPQLEHLRQLKGTELADALVFEGAPEDDSIDLDKSWDGIHYLFTLKTSQPKLSSLLPKAIARLFGKSNAGDSQQGGDVPPILGDIMTAGVTLYGSLDEGVTAYFDREKTQRISEAFQSASDQLLLSRFDPVAMAKAGVYLSEFWKADRDQALEYLESNLLKLKEFFRKASDEQKATLRTWC